jgi:hypothetical protein
MKINKEWHLKNKMLKNASFETRVEWHIAHQKNCDCRQMLWKLINEAKKRLIIEKKMKHIKLYQNEKTLTYLSFIPKYFNRKGTNFKR